MGSGSGASNTNTASTADDSSRMSATSTAPSSTASRADEWRSPHDMPFKNIPMPPVPKSSPAFSLKNSSRTFSFGRKQNTSTPPPPPVPAKGSRTPPPEPEYETGRARAVTASSYASTATPPKLDDRDFSLNLGGSFTDMFSGIGKRKSQVLDAEIRKPEPRSSVRHTGTRTSETQLTSKQDSTPPSGPAVRSFSSSHSNHPSPLHIDRNRNVEPSPYSWSSQHSQDGLMQSSTPPPPPAPQNGGQHPAPQNRPTGSTGHNLPSTRVQRPGGAAETGLRRNSGPNGRRQSLAEYRKSIDQGIDEDAKLLREAAYASQRLNLPESGPKVRDSWALPLNQFDKQPDEAAVAGFMNGVSADDTPRPKGVELHDGDDSMFDNNIAESANLAQRFEEISTSSPASKFAPKNKVMTPAQFERYKKEQDRLSTFGPLARQKQQEEEEEEENYEDEADDAEKAKQLASQRRRQEAHMSVYRQQMMKVTGETPSGLGSGLRPVATGAQSSPNLGTLGSLGRADDKEDEDEEVPLAILQAHGFPNKNKPPIRPVSSIPNLRAQSAMSGALPVFARNLPQDPYIGAGLAYPTNRESMGFSGGAGSVHGGSARNIPPNLPVGGLVGVIANEERSRAMRRGSPNPLGEYSTPPPPNGFDAMGAVGGMGGSSPNLRASTMIGGMPINPMMLSPGDQAQIQMSQQMQQFMQMQMQFMQLMTSGQMPAQPVPNAPQGLPDFSQVGRSASPQLRPGSSHQRSQTMMEASSSSWLPQGGLFTPSVRNQGGYAASIAPSERSNVGMPGRYRPVSHVPAAVTDNKSRASSIEGALQGWDNKNRASTIKVISKPSAASDEDDEEGWEEMAKKRENKRSLWRTKKENNDLREMLSYT